MEQLTLTVAGLVASYRIRRLLMDWDAPIIEVLVIDGVGEQYAAVYRSTEALNLMKLLNTLNLTTTSLHKRILTKLVTDGKLPAGTVTGTPDV